MADSGDDTIICTNCSQEFLKEYYKVCSNCFACTGCEIYLCPYCGERIAIKEPKKMRS